MLLYLNPERLVSMFRWFSDVIMPANYPRSSEIVGDSPKDTDLEIVPHGSAIQFMSQFSRELCCGVFTCFICTCMYTMYL